MGIFTPSGQHVFPDLRTPAGSELTEKLVTDGGLASDLPKLEGRSAPELEPSEQGHLPPQDESGALAARGHRPDGQQGQFCGDVRRSPPAIVVHCGVLSPASHWPVPAGQSAGRAGCPQGGGTGRSPPLPACGWDRARAPISCAFELPEGRLGPGAVPLAPAHSGGLQEWTSGSGWCRQL